MNDNVINLVRPPVNEDIIAILEEQLEEARAGNLRALALSVVTTAGEIGGEVYSGDCFAVLLASLTCIQHEIIDQARGA